MQVKGPGKKTIDWHLFGQPDVYLTTVGTVPRHRLSTEPSLTIVNTVFQMVLKR